MGGRRNQARMQGVAAAALAMMLGVSMAACSSGGAGGAGGNGSSDNPYKAAPQTRVTEIVAGQFTSDEEEFLQLYRDAYVEAGGNLTDEFEFRATDVFAQAKAGALDFSYNPIGLDVGDGWENFETENGTRMAQMLQRYEREDFDVALEQFREFIDTGDAIDSRSSITKMSIVMDSDETYVYYFAHMQKA